MNSPHVIQTRRGSFLANVMPRGQCGFVTGQKRFRYEARIEVADLDHNGWVLDNADLDKVFDRWRDGQWQASCEDLAGGGVCAILSLLGERAERVSVTVSPNEHASLTVEWRRGDARPHQCPVKVEKEEAVDAAVIVYGEH